MSCFGIEWTQLCNVIKNEKGNKMTVFTQQSSKYAYKHACSFVGYGEDVLSLMKTLYQYPKKKFRNIDYVYDRIYNEYEGYGSLPIADNIPKLCHLFIACQYFIWRLGEDERELMDEYTLSWDSVDEFIFEWSSWSGINIIVAILPKQNDKQKNREIAIENLQKLYEAGKCIYLIDEEKVDGEEAICREICRLTDGLLTIFCGENEMALSYADCTSVFEEGFIYCAQSENYKLERAFDVRQLVRVSGISDKVPVAVDRALLFIQCSYENELQPRQMEYIQEQFKWVNTHREIKWGFGYKDEGENDNFHSYAFFAQKKFPDYLKSNSVSCSGMERIQHCTVMRKMIDGK